MRIAHLSRRLFVKTALAGAAGTLIPRIAIGAGPTGGEAQPVANNASLSSLTLSEAAELVHSKKISPVELTKACLGRIERLNPKLNAFITVTADSALVNAHAAEAEIQRGRWKGPLHGIPIALKDLVDTAGVRTTAASGLFKDRVPTQDAEVVRRLRAAGGRALGQAQPARVRLRRQFGHQLLRSGSQSLERCLQSRRLFRRVCGRGRGATLLRCDRI